MMGMGKYYMAPGRKSIYVILFSLEFLLETIYNIFKNKAGEWGEGGEGGPYFFFIFCLVWLK